ncbi:MAG: ribosomal-processing cysteine protease Prp [Spirochaetes bacterium]|nr:ribosomal-processing cysteine protease Prp [Spirochaetota bacterium]
MIQVRASVQRNGCLRILEATGHASKVASGFSPVCAATTAILRTAGELLCTEKGLDVWVSAPEEGKFTVRVGEVPSYKVDRIQGITAFLLFGIQRLAEDAPKEVSFIFEEGV